MGSTGTDSIHRALACMVLGPTPFQEHESDNDFAAKTRIFTKRFDISDTHIKLRRHEVKSGVPSNRPKYILLSPFCSSSLEKREGVQSSLLQLTCASVHLARELRSISMLHPKKTGGLSEVKMLRMQRHHLTISLPFLEIDIFIYNFVKCESVRSGTRIPGSRFFQSRPRFQPWNVMDGV